MERRWDRNEKLFMSFFILLSCSIMAFIVRDFARIVTDMWCGFGSVMMEFGSIIEQLPV